MIEKLQTPKKKMYWGLWSPLNHTDSILSSISDSPSRYCRYLCKKQKSIARFFPVIKLNLSLTLIALPSLRLWIIHVVFPHRRSAWYCTGCISLVKVSEPLFFHRGCDKGYPFPYSSDRVIALSLIRPQLFWLRERADARHGVGLIRHYNSFLRIRRNYFFSWTFNALISALRLAISSLS